MHRAYIFVSVYVQNDTDNSSRFFICRPELAWIFAHTYIQDMNTHPCVRFRGSVPLNGKVITAKKNYFSRSNEFRAAFDSNPRALLRVDDGESSLALDEHVVLNFPGRLSDTSSVQGQQRLTVEQSENNATRQTSRKSRHDRTRVAIAILGETKVDNFARCAVINEEMRLAFFFFFFTLR